MDEHDGLAIDGDGAISMFGALPIGLFRAFRDGVLNVVNPALAGILGVADPDDLIGVNLDDFFVNNEALSELVQMIGDDPSELRGKELEIQRADGALTWVRANVRLVSEEGGEFLEGALDDVSEIHRAREEAANSRVLLDAVNEAHLLFVTGAGSDELFPGLVHRLLELTKSTIGFVVARSGPNAKDPGRVLATSGIPPAVALRRFVAELDGTRTNHDPADESGGAYLEIPIRRGDDLIGMVGLGGRPLGYGADVIVHLEPVLAACSTLIQAHRVDTQRQTVEAELEYTETATKAMLETAASGIVTAAADGKIRSFNLAAERLFGYDSDELIGENLAVLMPPPDTENHDRYLERYEMTG
ncbi:MAG: PAS domain S-box protein, partial [Acidimicrobiia bacterium]